MAYGKRKRSYSRPGGAKRRKTATRSRGGYRRRRRYGGAARNLKWLNPMVVPRRAMVSPAVGLAQTFLTKFRYKDFGQLNPSAGSSAAFIHYRLNSLFDPYYALGGNQPRYFDQLVTDNLYRQYLVYRVDYKVRVRNLNGSHDCQAGIHLAPDESSRWGPSTGNQMFYDGELNFTQLRMLNGKDEGGGAHRTTFMGTIHLAKLIGIKKHKLYDDPGYSGTPSSNPGNTPILTIAMADDPADASGDLIVADYDIELVFHTKLYDLAQNITQS